jgi:hypothetical protein
LVATAVTTAMHPVLGAVFGGAYVAVLYRQRPLWRAAAVLVFLVTVVAWTRSPRA